MLPEFGGSVWDLLFEPIDDITANTIAERIMDSIEAWEDRVEIILFDIEPKPSSNMYRCRLTYKILAPEVETETIDFILKSD
jgi:phage baseplate assembly protein W